MIFTIKKVLKNQVLNEKLATMSLLNVVKETMPVKYVTLHSVSVRNYNLGPLNILNHFLSIIRYLVNDFFIKKQKNIPLKKNYDFLILVPNKKYKSYYEIIKEGINGDCLALTIEEISFEHINIKKHNRSKVKTAFITFFILLTFSFQQLFKGKQNIKELINELPNIHKLIYFIQVFEQFFQEYKFSKYLSLAPNIDHHNIIELYFKDAFKNTFAIRATNTADSIENKYILTQNLFYKSILEKCFYENHKLQDKMKLTKASLLLNNIKLKTEPIKKIRILTFIDNCLVRKTKINEARDNAIDNFYNFISKHTELKVYHRFHPALPPKQKQELIKKYKHLNIVFIDDIDDISYLISDLVLSTFSTLLQEIIPQKIPILLIDLYFSLNMHREKYFDLDESPAVVIKNQQEMNYFLKKLFTSEDPCNLLHTEELYEWYKDLYNFPEGLHNFFNVLNK